ISRPRAALKPAANAAVWPKLRRNRITRTRRSVTCHSRRRANVSSVLPSSTRMSSYGRPQALSASVNSLLSGPTFSPSLKTGMTTERSGATVYSGVILRCPTPAPQEDHHAHGREHAGKPERGPRDVVEHVGHGLLAIPVRQNGLAAVPESATDDHREHEGRRRDVRDARDEHERLERHGGRQNRRHDDCE